MRMKKLTLSLCVLLIGAGASAQTNTNRILGFSGTLPIIPFTNAVPFVDTNGAWAYTSNNYGGSNYVLVAGSTTNKPFWRLATGFVASSPVSHTNIIGNTNIWTYNEWGIDPDVFGNLFYTKMNASGGANLGGTMWWPRGTYTFDASVDLPSGAQAGALTDNFAYGNYDINGSKQTVLYNTTGSNLFTIRQSNYRRTEVNNLNFLGTNYPISYGNNKHIGIAYVGPSGMGTRANELTFRQFDVGMAVEDTTGFEIANSLFLYNAIGLAIGYKPDGVAVRNSRFDRNIYGVWTHWTNSQMIKSGVTAGNPTLDNCVFGLNTNAGILHARGPLYVRAGYFEANGTNLGTYTAMQLGFNTADPYQQSFTNVWGHDPEVLVDGYDANYSHGFRFYRKGWLRFLNPSSYGTVVPYAVMMNSLADDSTVWSDKPIVVTNSSGEVFNVPANWMFQSNAIVPTDVEIPATVSLTGDDQVIGTHTNTWFVISSDNTTPANRTMVLTTARTGRILTLQWSGSNDGQIVDDQANSGSGNVRLTANWEPTSAHATLVLRGYGNDWIEVSRATP